MSDDPADIGFETAFALPQESGRRPLDGNHTYDVIILGAGPAGLSAAIYLMRKGVDCGLIGGTLGGQVARTLSIENYLGYRLIDGAAMVEKFNEQLREFGLPMELGRKVTECTQERAAYLVTAGGEAFRARCLIIVTGKRPRTLGVPGEERLLGKGVAYCAICDAPLYRGKTVAVVGGGNSGLEAAIDLARGSPRVHLIERGPSLTGDALLRKRIEQTANISVHLRAEVAEISGAERVESIRLKSGDEGGKKEIALEGIFVEAGLDPNSEPFRGIVDMNGRGEIEVDCLARTSAPGIFAAGDVTTVPFKQIVIAAGDGAKAALSASDYLLRRDGKKREEE